MKLNLENLIAAIEEQQAEFTRISKLFGSDDLMTFINFDRLHGMQAAFEALTGMDYFDYKLAQRESLSA